MLIEIPSFTWTISNYILWNTYVFVFDNIPQQFVKKKICCGLTKKKYTVEAIVWSMSLSHNSMTSCLALLHAKGPLSQK